MSSEIKGDVVVKLGQPFTSVQTAEDKDLIFSSKFPLLKEEATGSYSASSLPHTGTSYVPIYSHNLKYHPFFIVYQDAGSGVEMKLGTDWVVDDTTLYIKDSSATSTSFRWVVYRLPLYEQFESDILGGKVTVPALYDGRYVIKASREGKDITSTDLRDFTLHSRGRSPLIHRVDVKNWSGTNTNHTVDPGLTYNPICFGFAKISGKSANLENGGQSTPYLSRVEGKIKITSTTATNAQTSIVVFKDPFIAPKSYEVRY